jgi:N-carbamoyl-L-amino-acid hydrolase
VLTEKVGCSAARIRDEIEALARIVSPSAAGYTRISFSPEDIEARDRVMRAMEAAGLSVRVDAAGNIMGRMDGATDAPPILAGSHIDTVEGGGMFDGVAGVVAAIEAAGRLKAARARLAHPLEVVVFTAEEPSPFGISTIGSRAMAGKLRPDRMALADKSGRRLGEAIARLGGDPDRIGEAARPTGGIRAYLELHIEQGPRLAAAGVPVGVVTGIAGIRRGTVRVSGRADHAGTMPMGSRKDALAAASEAVLALEAVCESSGGEVVGTVGRIEAYPNALNVVPGSVTMGMEMRGLDEGRLDAAADAFREAVGRIEARRGVVVEFTIGVSSISIRFPEDLVNILEAACAALGVPCMKLASWAGHDANHLAEVAPAVMLFVPSEGGRSHCAEERTDFDDIATGAEVLAAAIREIDGRH